MKRIEKNENFIIKNANVDCSGVVISSNDNVSRMIMAKTKENAEMAEKEKKSNRMLFLTVLLIGFVILTARLFITPSVICGSSMYPTFENGDIVFAVNADIYGGVTYNDVVSFSNKNTKGKVYIKRIMGVPGDTVQIIDGCLYRNGDKVNETFDAMNDAGLFSEPVVLGEDEYLVLGDNRNNSTDGRVIGPVKENDIMYVITEKIF